MGTVSRAFVLFNISLYNDVNYLTHTFQSSDDKNIMPILGLLNLVAVSIVCLEPENFFQRGLLTLNIAFVEIGIRMTTDSHLPSVAYQIKMQRMLNEYFCGLLFLVLESIVVYEMWHFGCSQFQTDLIDWIAAILSLAHNVWTQFFYYRDAAQAKREIKLVPLCR